jgi:Co/Zn/Cd efflux system component
MHTDDLSQWTHHHRFDTGNEAGERGARSVMWITLAMMVVEIVAGWSFNSMALLADGWHMSSHALAIGLSAFAYAAARGHAADGRYAFGTWKMEVLAGFASAILLLGIAALMVYGSVERIITPQPIHYVEAIAVAAVGLAVNLVSAWILGTAHHHDHHHDSEQLHGNAHRHGAEHHHDLNLKSAYLHVAADAATSVLAIVALAGGWLWGWSWLDPAPHSWRSGRGVSSSRPAMSCWTARWTIRWWTRFGKPSRSMRPPIRGSPTFTSGAWAAPPTPARSAWLRTTAT